MERGSGNQELAANFEVQPDLPDIVESYGHIDVPVAGITGPLSDMDKLCPIDKSQRSLEDNNRFAIKLLNKAGAEILPEHEEYFMTELDQLGVEPNITVRAPADERPVDELIRKDGSDASIKQEHHATTAKNMLQQRPLEAETAIVHADIVSSIDQEGSPTFIASIAGAREVQDELRMIFEDSIQPDRPLYPNPSYTSLPVIERAQLRDTFVPVERAIVSESFTAGEILSKPADDDNFVSEHTVPVVAPRELQPDSVAVKPPEVKKAVIVMENIRPSMPAVVPPARIERAGYPERSIVTATDVEKDAEYAVFTEGPQHEIAVTDDGSEQIMEPEETFEQKLVVIEALLYSLTSPEADDEDEEMDEACEAARENTTEDKKENIFVELFVEQVRALPELPDRKPEEQPAAILDNVLATAFKLQEARQTESLQPEAVEEIKEELEKLCQQLFESMGIEADEKVIARFVEKILASDLSNIAHKKLTPRELAKLGTHEYKLEGWFRKFKQLLDDALHPHQVMGRVALNLARVTF